MAESPGSPLSSHASSEFTEDVKLEDRESSFGALPDHSYSHLMPPAKRQKLRASSHRSTPQSQIEPLPEDLDVSSDTSGDIPNSPPTGQASTQDDDHLEQVTVCKWRNCPVGDLGNMDVLVAHIHEIHIGQRQKKYACEWENCSRIDANHASGYALRAHMRSHTREKPFYCALPECDRSFTRSDALAKHMRTVHETEALRPSDPIPRSHSQAQVKPQRLKLIVSKRPTDPGTTSSPPDHPSDDDATTTTSNHPGTTSPPLPLHLLDPFDYPPELHLTDDERAMPPDQLFRFLRRQLHWTEQENRAIRAEVAALETERMTAWQAKELLLTNYIEAELAVTARREGFREGDASDMTLRLTAALLPHHVLPMTGPLPWWRGGRERERDL